MGVIRPRKLGGVQMKDDNVVFVPAGKYRATYKVNVALYQTVNRCGRKEAEYFIDAKDGILCY